MGLTLQELVQIRPAECTAPLFFNKSNLPAVTEMIKRSSWRFDMTEASRCQTLDTQREEINPELSPNHQ